VVVGDAVGGPVRGDRGMEWDGGRVSLRCGGGGVGREDVGERGGRGRGKEGCRVAASVRGELTGWEKFKQ